MSVLSRPKLRPELRPELVEGPVEGRSEGRIEECGERDESWQTRPSSSVGFSRGDLLLRSGTRLSSSAFAPERFLRTGRRDGESNNNQ